ncbi:MAG: NUDIX hydrolase [Actinobacteria bacterium]|uniref:NUDIX hydrolase n=1 Tax=Candidatus Fonsibacter lacus TaxID=2576439 RepID=A0A965GCI2_9PROT|nr:NUDIX hydrolase [Candidatus Fonsibacter lacus]
MSRTSGEGGLEPVFIAPVSSPSSPNSPSSRPPKGDRSRPPKKKQGHRNRSGKKPGAAERGVSEKPNPSKKRVGKNQNLGKRVEEISAGGLVVDKSGERGLLIGRIDKRGRILWSLPKGHIEEGESPEQAAIREVLEETGIKSSISRSLGVIDFWFMAEGKRIHKTVHHFLFAELSGTLVPQVSEVDDVKWFPLDDIVKTLAYPDERKLIQRSGDLRV